MILDYLAVAGLVFAINLLPAFGPPTSAVLVSITLSVDLAPVPLVACGALAAASGRYVLASGTRRLRPRLSKRRREHLEALEGRLTVHRSRTIAGLGLFALSPVPSGQLFVAAGLMRVPLLPLTVAFFCGRLVSYSIYVAGAAAIRESLGDAIVDGVRSPLGLAAQLLAVGALVLLLRVDWADRLGGGRSDETSPGADPPEPRR